MILGLVLGLAAVPAVMEAVAALLSGASFWQLFGIGAVIVALLAAVSLTRARLKVIRDYPEKGQSRWHWSGWRFKFYDAFERELENGAGTSSSRR